MLFICCDKKKMLSECMSSMTHKLILLCCTRGWLWDDITPTIGKFGIIWGAWTSIDLQKNNKSILSWHNSIPKCHQTPQVCVRSHLNINYNKNVNFLRFLYNLHCWICDCLHFCTLWMFGKIKWLTKAGTSDFKCFSVKFFYS